jgi:hypothetical protein
VGGGVAVSALLAGAVIYSRRGKPAAAAAAAASASAPERAAAGASAAPEPGAAPLVADMAFGVPASMVAADVHSGLAPAVGQPAQDSMA